MSSLIMWFLAFIVSIGLAAAGLALAIAGSVGRLSGWPAAWTIIACFASAGIIWAILARE